MENLQQKLIPTSKGFPEHIFVVDRLAVSVTEFIWN